MESRDYLGDDTYAEVMREFHRIVARSKLVDQQAQSAPPRSPVEGADPAKAPQMAR